MFSEPSAPSARHHSATSDERAHIALLLDVARRYWEQGQGQAEIASAVGWSRPTISRLLSEARERGVVSIRISHPLERVLSIERALKERYALQAARVAAPEEGATVQAQVARCAADLVVEQAREDVVLAVSNGVAVAATVHSLPDLAWPASRVVQMIGSTGASDVLLDSPETVRSLAARLGGRYHALPVPLVVGSAEIAAGLRENDQVSTTLELAARADMALVGVGAVHRGRSGAILSGFEDVAQSAALAELGAVGHISGHHFDAQGRHLHTPLCDRTIAVDPERMRSIPLVVGVAWGADKLPALRGALAGGFLSALVTDRETAVALLDRPR